MAHFTGLKELQNHPHKAGFDIGSKNVFTAKVGELLPVYWDMAIPDCDYDIDLAYFTRTRPVQTAAYTRVREYFDFYAVPCDLLWKSFDSAVIQMGQIAPVQSKTLLDPLALRSADYPECTLSILDHHQFKYQPVYSRYPLLFIRVGDAIVLAGGYHDLSQLGDR